jgi:sporulation protein YlmC with PRC-barrel domain
MTSSITSGSERASIIELGDTDLSVARSDDDIRGRDVVDKSGEEIGKVDGLMIDERESKVRFLQVAAGGFLGIGEHTFLIPVDAVTRVDEEQVQVDQTRDRIVGGPKYDPDLVQAPDYWDGVYGYYGYTPYWGAGYVYPRYPRY